MSTADEAWDRFRAELEELGRSLRGRADLEEVRRAGEAVMDSVGRVVQDQHVREGTRRAAQSLGDAMAATLNQVAEALRSKRP